MRLVSQIQIQSQPQSQHPSRILNLLFVILTRNTSFKTQNRLESLESVSHCGEGNPDLIYGLIPPDPTVCFPSVQTHGHKMLLSSSIPEARLMFMYLLEAAVLSKTFQRYFHLRFPVTRKSE